MRKEIIATLINAGRPDLANAVSDAGSFRLLKKIIDFLYDVEDELRADHLPLLRKIAVSNPDLISKADVAAFEKFQKEALRTAKRFGALKNR